MIAIASNQVEIWLFILVFAVLVVVGAINAVLKGRAETRTELSRQRGLRDLAARLGFESFSPERDDQFTRSWDFLPRLTHVGEDHYAFHILRGTYRDQSLFIFDFIYMTGGSKNPQEHVATMLLLIFKEVFPLLTIGPENLEVKFAEAFGVANDVKFESAEFSRKYCVRSPDKKFAYDVCNSKMMEYLLQNPGLQIEFNLQRLVEIRSNLPQYLFTKS